jgi:hypothetical protein
LRSLGKPFRSELSPNGHDRCLANRIVHLGDEGMGIEAEDYIACWMEITVEEPSDMDAKQVVLLGTDFQCRLNGRRITLRKRQD